MVTNNLLKFLNDFQKFALKVKIQQILDTMVKDDRVREAIDADKVFDYYNEMHEEFAKNPHNFLFPNREWLWESLKRLNIDVSEIFNVGANVDHIKREEIIVLFMLLWIHMKIQDPDSSSDVKTPYDLFIMWIYDRVFIARPTDTRYLQDGDRKVLDRIYDKYGWFTKGHCFTIGVKGAVEYHHSSPDDITNIDGVYNKAHGSVTKLRSNFKGFSFGRPDKNSVRYMMNWAMSRLTKEQHELGRSEKKTPLVWEHDIKSVLVKVPKDIQERIHDIDFDDFDDIIGKLADDVLKEKHRSRNIARNTKFVVHEMTGMSNKDYKAFLKKFKEKEVTRYDETSQCFEDILKISGLELDHEVILEAANQYNRSIYHLNKALLKLKEKLNEEKDQ